jgi:hypothetical protein
VSRSKAAVEVARIESRILVIRGEKVIVDADLAEFYGVTTKRLNEQVKRNRRRFPQDFVFRLTASEKSEVVAKCDHLTRLRFSRTAPYAFTEHGALMAASVLNTSHAVEVSVFVVRAFVRLREMLAQHADLARKLTQLERKLADHDEQILALLAAMRELIRPSPVPRRRRIGFGGEP